MAFFGITAKNEEQKHALRILNNNKPFTIITGQAGTGKSLLTQAVGLEKTLESNAIYRKMIYTRLQIQMGKDLGYLTGDVNAKTYPFVAPFMDNLDVMSTESKNIKDYIFIGDEEGKKQPNAKQKIFFDPIQTMRGGTKMYTYFMLDEVQNLDHSTLHGVATRIGVGSKFVYTGNFSQIDEERLRDPEKNGFYKFLKGLYELDPEQKYFDHINLTKVERHPVIDLVESIFREDTMNPLFKELEERGNIR